MCGQFWLDALPSTTHVGYSRIQTEVCWMKVHQWQQKSIILLTDKIQWILLTSRWVIIITIISNSTHSKASIGLTILAHSVYIKRWFCTGHGLQITNHTTIMMVSWLQHNMQFTMVINYNFSNNQYIRLLVVKSINAQFNKINLKHTQIKGRQSSINQPTSFPHLSQYWVQAQWYLQNLLV